MCCLEQERKIEMKVSKKVCVMPSFDSVMIYATNMVPKEVPVPPDVIGDKEKLEEYIKDEVDAYEELRKEQAELYGELG
jgi:hypothetical protein